MKTNTFRITILALALALFVVEANAQRDRRTTNSREKKPLIDKSEAQATAEAPVAAQVEEVKLPYDPSLPMYVVIVEPFDYSASGQISGGGQAAPMATDASTGESVTVTDDNRVVTTWSSASGPNIGKGISTQLMTALSSGWPNVAIVEPDFVQRKADGTYSLKLQPGEVGPFIIRGTVTEFSETAEADAEGKRFNTKKLGLATGVIGAITGNRAATGVGAGVAILGPDFKNEKMKRTGMVGLDLRVIDARTSRIAPGGAFDCQGSFTTIAAASGVDVFGVSSGRSAMAASSLGQATRAAMNDALVKTSEVLKRTR